MGPWGEREQLATEEGPVETLPRTGQNRFQMPCASLQESEGNWSWNQTNQTCGGAVKDARPLPPQAPTLVFFPFLGLHCMAHGIYS